MLTLCWLGKDHQRDSGVIHQHGIVSDKSDNYLSYDFDSFRGIVQIGQLDRYNGKRVTFYVRGVGREMLHYYDVFDIVEETN